MPARNSVCEDVAGGLILQGLDQVSAGLALVAEGHRLLAALPDGARVRYPRRVRKCAERRSGRERPR